MTAGGEQATLLQRLNALPICNLSPTLSQKQVGGLTLVLILGVCGYWFGGEPDTANDFSCSSWQTVIGTLRRSKNLDHATVIVGHGTSNMAILRKGSHAPGLHDRMPIASATKWVTAAIIMRLVDLGTLALTDSPGKFLSWWRPLVGQDMRANVTLHHLLSMTSGLAAKATRPCTFGAASLDECARDVYHDYAPQRNASGPVMPAPGVAFAYSGNHLVVAAAMAEAATGKPIQQLFEDLVGRRLLLRDKPLFATAEYGVASVQGAEGAQVGGGVREPESRRQGSSPIPPPRPPLPPPRPQQPPPGIQGVRPQMAVGGSGSVYSSWVGAQEKPAALDVSGGLLISPSDYARFLRALLPTVEPPEGHLGETLQYTSLLPDASRHDFFGSHTTNAKHVKTLSTFVGGYTWQYAYGHWVECDARTPENRRLREDRESAERRGRRGERRAEEEGLCRADHSVQSSMGAFGFYPLIVLDDNVQAARAEEENIYILVAPNVTQPSASGASGPNLNSAMSRSVEFRKEVFGKIFDAVPRALALQGSPWEGEHDDDEEFVCLWSSGD